MAARKKDQEATPALPADERKALSAGIAFALACAAALSAPTLYLLACLIGYPPQLAWLLPASFDGYAGTSIWVGRRIARTHPAAKAARRNARIALGMTICCNGLYHLLVLAGAAVPRGLHIGLLVTVSSLPPFIVDRLLHLNAIANGSADTAPATTTAAPEAKKTDDAKRRQAPAAIDDAKQPATPEPTATATPKPTTTPAVSTAEPTTVTDDADARTDDEATTAEPSTDGGATVTNLDDRRRSDDAWAAIAAPHYRGFVQRNAGKTPSGPQLAAMLASAGHPKLSPTRAREIRRATETYLAKHPEDETERAGVVA